MKTLSIVSACPTGMVHVAFAECYATFKEIMGREGVAVMRNVEPHLDVAIHRALHHGSLEPDRILIWDPSVQADPWMVAALVKQPFDIISIAVPKPDYVWEVLPAAAEVAKQRPADARGMLTQPQFGMMRRGKENPFEPIKCSHDVLGLEAGDWVEPMLMSVSADVFREIRKDPRAKLFTGAVAGVEREVMGYFFGAYGSVANSPGRHFAKLIGSLGYDQNILVRHEGRPVNANIFGQHCFVGNIEGIVEFES